MLFCNCVLFFMLLVIIILKYHVSFSVWNWLQWACWSSNGLTDGTLVVVVVYFYFLYHNKQTSAKTWWAFKVITPPPQCGIYISKIKSNSRSEVWCGDVWLRRMLERVRTWPHYIREREIERKWKWKRLPRRMVRHWKSQSEFEIGRLENEEILARLPRLWKWTWMQATDPHPTDFTWSSLLYIGLLSKAKSLVQSW